MNKLANFSLLAATLSLPVGAWAAPWAIVATQFKELPECTAGLVDCRDGIYTIDLGYSTPKVYGPFLQDQIDPERDPPTTPPTYVKGIFDLAVRPGGNEVLVSIFAASEVVRIDVSDPKNPQYAGRLKMEYDTGMLDEFNQPVIYSFWAEDIAITPDGKTAIVSDGGFSPFLGFIDLNQWKLKNIQKLVCDDPLLDCDDPYNPGEKIQYYAQANAIAPDNQTVLFVDYFGGMIHHGKLNPTQDGIVDIQSIPSCSQPDPSDPQNCLGMLGRPVNITLSPPSPMGTTAIVNLAAVEDPSWGPGVRRDGYVNVLKISPSGQVTPGTPFFIGGLPRDKAPLDASSAGGNQSTAFGLRNRAYVLTQPIPTIPTGSQLRLTAPGGSITLPVASDPRNILAELRVIAPGQVTLVNSNFAALASEGTSQLFGVDSLASSPLAPFILASNPTVSGGTNKLTLVNPMVGTKKTIALREDAIPVGIDIK